MQTNMIPIQVRICIHKQVKQLPCVLRLTYVDHMKSAFLHISENPKAFPVKNEIVQSSGIQCTILRFLTFSDVAQV